MFALFFSLYLAMFRGTFVLYNGNDIATALKPCVNGLGSWLTSMFNNVETPYNTLGDVLFEISGNAQAGYFPSIVSFVSFVLALITSIGIVVMAVKGIKKAFGIFFMGIRNI